MLPFTRAEFMQVFAFYNLAIWPAQLAAYVLGFAMVAAVWRPSRRSAALVAAGLAAMWLWTGIAYHWLRFAAINPAALLFGAMFVAQGVLLAAAAVRGTLRFAPPSGVSSWAGLGLVVYASAIYPAIGRFAGHEFPAAPMFGVTPCPVAIFAFGMLLMATSRVSPWLLAIPLAWSLVGGSAAFLLGVPEDWLLPASGAGAVAIVLRQRRAARVADLEKDQSGTAGGCIH